MKKSITNKLFLAFLLLQFCSSGYAQRPGQPNALSFKRVFVNYLAPYTEGASLSNYKAAWEAAYHRQILKSGVNLVVPVRVGVASFKDSITTTPFWGADLQLQYQYLRDKLPISPYIFAGVGFASEKGGQTGVEIPLGIGLEIYFNKQAALQFFGSYRLGLQESRNNLQHGIGFKYIIGKSMEEKPMVDMPKDSDGDGVVDGDDKCMTIPGLKKYNGCPDADGDGIPEYDDLCPDQAGPKETKGCPDKDKDGIADFHDDCPDVFGVKAKKGCPEDEKPKDTDGDGITDDMDKCPTVAGIKSMMGCPGEEKSSDQDSDGDGVLDSKDKCPKLAGLKYLDGCPDSDDDGVADNDDRCPTIAGKKALKGCPDTDGDGVSDLDDKCPLVAGTPANKGCPEIEKEEKAVLDFAMKAVQFDLGKWTLRPESYPILDKIVIILKKYPEYSLAIYGHTDNSGKEETNQKLSNSRARSCFEYLESKGISPKRMVSRGFGSEHPLHPNTTESGRILNRRVEFIMSVQ